MLFFAWPVFVGFSDPGAKHAVMVSVISQTQ